jgi:hypothetical protein
VSDGAWHTAGCTQAAGVHNRLLTEIFGPKREKVMEDGENYIVRSFMICTPHQI